MTMRILTIAKLTFHETTRRKITLIAGLLGLAFVLFYNLAFYFTREQPYGIPNAPLARQEVLNLLLMAGLYAANFMVGIMAALLSADSLSGDISSGAIHSLASKPIRRFEIVLGKWLGFAGLQALYVFLLVGGLILSVGLQTGFYPPNVWTGASLIYLETLVMMSITLALSSRLSTLASGAAVFGLFGIAFLGGWVEQIGSVFRNQTAVDIGIVASLLMPTEALWRRASYEMTSTILRALGNFNPFGGGASIPSPLMIAYAIFFVVATLGAALWSFHRRDL